MGISLFLVMWTYFAQQQLKFSQNSENESENESKLVMKSSIKGFFFFSREEEINASNPKIENWDGMF